MLNKTFKDQACSSSDPFLAIASNFSSDAYLLLLKQLSIEKVRGNKASYLDLYLFHCIPYKL